MPLHLFPSITLLSLLVLFSAPSVSAQDAISLDKVNYIALSPEAAALHDAVNYPADGNKGVPAINDPSSLGTDKFGISYSYETGTTPQYGGNISGATWAHAGGSSQAYAYTYDNYGRLTSGTHSGGNSETVAYDNNGNLTGMTRTGARAETLAYTYSSGTNKLSKVTVGGVQKSYAYNADGTMKTDGLRGLTVTYSPVKLPNKIKVSSNTGTVDYIYDALGNKLAVKQGGTMKNVYCGDFVYNTSLAVDYILTPNGQLTRNPSTGAFTTQYNITDHLGNVRSVVSSGSTVLQSTDYYPFGLAFSDANITNNRYLYNGKELEDYTVGTSYLGTLDYGARHYDPRIARWTVPDPMAEKYYGVNAYSYCMDSPIVFVDPKGNEVRPKGDNELELIRNTVPEDARCFIELNDRGTIDASLLQQYKGRSSNFSSLMELVSSSLLVNVSLSDSFEFMDQNGLIKSATLTYLGSDPFFEDRNIEYVSGLTTGEIGNYGKTLFPDREGIQNSPSSDIEVFIHPSLSKIGAAEAFSHEAYGHALLYIRNGGNHTEASHKVEGMVETNTVLKTMILGSRRETVSNLKR